MRAVIGAVTLLLGMGATMSPASAGVCPSGLLGPSRVIEVGGTPALPVGLQSYPRTIDLRDHEVALTFDDGPSAATTPRVLDALRAECVRATFFLIGRNAESLPALVRRELNEGHTVGHHSWSHPARTLRGMDEAAGRAEVDHGIDAVEIAGYGERAARPHTPFFRFPGYADTPALLAYLAGRGITVFGSDLWASDWRPMTPEAERALVFARLERAGRGIILFHDTKASTADMLPGFLRELRQRGYRIVHLVPGAGPTPVAPAPAGWKSTTEPIIARTLGGAAPQ